MSTLEAVQFILSYFGFATIVNLVIQFFNARAARTARRTEYLRRQLQDLYGPLYFLASSNDALIRHGQKVLEAHKKEYEEGGWSQSRGIQESIREESFQTIRVANQYVHEVNLRNDHIVDVLENNYHLVDPTDHGVFRDFILDRARMKVETPDNGPLEVPYRVYRHLGDISYMRSMFFQTVTSRFREKKAELDKLIQ